MTLRTTAARVIVGALFDFAGYLTSREQTIEVGATANASPMADLLEQWAIKRGLSLSDAAVMDWQEAVSAEPPVNPLDHGIDYGWHGWAFKFTHTNAIRIVMPTGRMIDVHAFPPSAAEAVLYAMAKTIMYHDAETNTPTGAK